MREKMGIFSKYLFETSFVLYLILLVVDLVKEGFVTNVFNMNFLLGVILISGSIMILSGYEEVTQLVNFRLKESDWYLIIGLSILGSVVVYIKLIELGNIAYVISTITFILCLLLSYLVITEDSEK